MADPAAVTTPTITPPGTAITTPTGGSIPPSAQANINDMSDIYAARPASSGIPSQLLPIRAEKRYITNNPIQNITTTAANATSSSTKSGQKPITPRTKDFYTSAAKSTFVDYVVVRIPHRGLDSNGHFSPQLTAEYRFLINPQTATVSRNAEDAQTFTRGGWQFGVWGESLITIAMTGHTPGQYWTYGLTDGFAYFTESWRNLQQLNLFVENNGYWFEGEEYNEGPLAPGYTRRRIKKHQDVQLIVGNFIWLGMFQDFSYTLDAEHPYRAVFNFTFLAWKERLRNTSPYNVGLPPNNVERGHSYGAYSNIVTEQKPKPPAGTPNGTPLTSAPVVQAMSVSPSINPNTPGNATAPATNSFKFLNLSDTSLFPSSSYSPNLANGLIRSSVFNATGSA